MKKIKFKGFFGGINSYFGWIGGKKASRKRIVQKIPKGINLYVEVFTGAGWIFFYKKRGNHKEILNDFNALLVNLHVCVRDRLEEFLEEIKRTINARDYFKWIKKRLESGVIIDDVKRATAYFELIKYSYSAGTKSYAGRHINLTRNIDVIKNASDRLQDVLIENLSFEELIPRYDGEKVFFYLDPPYYETEDFYQNIGKEGFTYEKHILLRDILLNVKGKFLLSYNDCEFIRELYSDSKFYIESYERPHSLRQRYESGSVFKEILISNYDTNIVNDEMKQMKLEIM